MKHVTRWHSDTCGCVIDYSWDDGVPDALYEAMGNAQKVREEARVSAEGEATESEAEALASHLAAAEQAVQDVDRQITAAMQTSAATRQHRSERVQHRCPAHLGHRSTRGKPHHVVYAVALEENNRKNLMVGQLLTAHADTHGDRDPKTGALAPKDGSHSWRFDHDRVLHFHVQELEEYHKAALQAHADEAHGPGKVVVH